MIVAAAAGAAAGRATAPRVSNVVTGSPVAPAPVAGGIAFGSSGVPAGETTASRVSNAADSLDARARLRSAGSTRESGTQAVVYVAGAVARPGVYALRATARADDALRAAGGATTAADLVAINLAARVEDGEEIAVPVKGAETTAMAGLSSPTTKSPRRHAGKRGRRRKRHRNSADAAAAPDTSPTTDAPAEMVDVNAADEAALETLPGIGPSLAQRIIAFRDLNGPFASTDELLDVGGMTAGKLDALSPYVTFH